MLSLKLALIQVADVPTMVFDEIDIGVSGRIADAIGKMIRALAKKRQVLTITHLPQIAVMADTHFSARKRIAGGRTVTDLVLLDDKARQIELASLLSGDTLADTALAHAKELMERVGGTSKAAPVLSEKAPRTKKR
jgi:DNA repair protein RecN (Recombination protein N)